MTLREGLIYLSVLLLWGAFSWFVYWTLHVRKGTLK